MADALRASVVHAPDRAALQAQLDVLPDALVLDLSTPGWRPHFAASELLAQLDGPTTEELLEDLPPVLLPTEGRVEARHVASWIDVELFGDPDWLMAERVAAVAARQHRLTLLALMPVAAEDLSRGDALTLSAVAHALADRGGRLVLGYARHVWALPDDLGLRVDGAEAGLPPEGCAIGMGGVLDSALLTKLRMMGLLRSEPAKGGDNAFVFELPGKPRASDDQGAFTLECLRSWDWRGLALRPCEDLSADELALFAWRCVAARDLGFATLLARRAALADPDSSGAAQALQTIAIIGQDYQTGAAATEPKDQAASLGRAWCQLLSGVDGATAAFPQHVNIKGALGCYLANITALARLRAGDLDGAWRLQMAIFEELATQAAPSPHLVFLNHLNTGRLKRSKKDWTGAEKDIRAAFAARGGGLSEHDLLYQAALLADLSMQAGDMRAASQRWREALRLAKGQNHLNATPRRAFRLICGVPPERYAPPAKQLLAALSAHVRNCEAAVQFA